MNKKTIPISCCAIGCANRHVKGTNVQFFRFPAKNQARLSAWISALRRRDWKPTEATRICSAHFKPDDFLDRPETGVLRLKPGSVPTVFPGFSAYLQACSDVHISTDSETVEIERPDENVHNLEWGLMGWQVLGSLAPEPQKVSVIPLSNETIENELPEQLSGTGSTKHLRTREERTRELLTEKRKKIKVLQLKVRRQAKKIKCLKLLVDQLKRRKLLENDLQGLLAHYSSSGQKCDNMDHSYSRKTS